MTPCGVTWLIGLSICFLTIDVIFEYGIKVDGKGKEGKEQQRYWVINAKRMSSVDEGMKDVVGMREMK